MTNRLTYKPKASPHDIVRYIKAHYRSQTQRDPVRPKSVKTLSVTEEKEQKENELKAFEPEPSVETR